MVVWCKSGISKAHLPEFYYLSCDCWLTLAVHLITSFLAGNQCRLFNLASVASLSLRPQYGDTNTHLSVRVKWHSGYKEPRVDTKCRSFQTPPLPFTILFTRSAFIVNYEYSLTRHAVGQTIGLGIPAIESSESTDLNVKILPTEIH